MSTVFSSSWSVVSEAADGSILDINFFCPKCGYDTGTVNYTSQSGLEDFEIDVECPVCGADLTVVCCHEDKI